MAEPITSTELRMVSEQPLVAVLTIHTDEGESEFGVNAQVASGLIDMLAQFLRRGRKPS